MQRPPRFFFFFFVSRDEYFDRTCQVGLITQLPQFQRENSYILMTLGPILWFIFFLPIYSASPSLFPPS